MNDINLAFCINDNYTPQLIVVLWSIMVNLHSGRNVNTYIFSSDISQASKNRLYKMRLWFKNLHINFIDVDNAELQNMPKTIDYISAETYYRYVIPELLPDIDKILYLDADIIVNGDISPLYDTDISKYYMAGGYDLYIDDIKYKPEIGFGQDDLYVNTGVLLMNLKQMRTDNIPKKLINTTKKMAGKIKYQDQDIINIVCRGKILQFDSIYNYTSHNILKEKRKYKRAVIIHYTGANKPWLPDSNNPMRHLWRRYAEKAAKMNNRKIRVALLIDEFFGGAGTAFGGYGALARKYIAKYIPNDDIEMDVLLGTHGHRFTPRKYHVDDVDLYRLPRKHWASRLFLRIKNYDVYLSIELTDDWVLRHETNPNKKLILSIQDPRPKSAWENTIDTMQSIKDPCFYTQHIYDTVNGLYLQNRVKFISQGYSLNKLGMELYNLPLNTPIQYLPNPIEMDMDFKFDIKNKKKQIIFLGRLEAQKRCWLFCEVAKRMPEYEFYVLGQFFRYPEDNKRMMSPYMNGDIPNLHFVGHVDGNEKAKLLKESRLLLSTAIWEGIPISWLEALSYGTILVSDLEREELAGKFGKFVGEISGDGFDGVDKFIPAIRELMENDKLYIANATAAIEYIRNRHNIPRFINDMRNVIYQEL